VVRGRNMSMRFTLSFLYNELGTDISGSLIDGNDGIVSNYQREIFKTVQDKLGVDSVYFMNAPGTSEAKIPMIYFSALDNYDSEKIAEIHRLAWNLSKAPLLFIVTPDELIIMNNYEIPIYNKSRIPSNAILERIKLVDGLEASRQALSKYHVNKLESGEFWRENAKRFDYRNRVEKTLLENLKIVRESLLKSINSCDVVHRLLGRIIMIKYFEERKDKNGSKIFPNDIFSQFKPGAIEFNDLLDNKESVYDFFKFMSSKFNGDIFPVTDEEYYNVSDENLQQLKEFITGTTQMKNNQLALWPLYSFEVIPIELISNIYEMFFHMEKSAEEKTKKTKKSENRKGTYYTPFHLVELVLDEIYPWEGKYESVRVIDPACGSGIFLVEAFRRIVGRWNRDKKYEYIPGNDLISLLSSSIYGVDINREALRIASFSLCLTLCDYMSSKDIWNEFKFPTLRANNLIESDFFAEDLKINYEKYDIVIGNPPWVDALSIHASEYQKKNNYPVGSQQIAQLFVLKAADICKISGKIGMILPSKSILYNVSTTNTSFRRFLFKNFNVDAMIDLTAFRKLLFASATGPAVIMFYSPRSVDYSKPILFCSPRPQYTLEDNWRIFIESYNINRIPKDLSLTKYIWKIAMLGKPRDVDLISKIERHPTLKKLEKDNILTMARGFSRASDLIYTEEFLGKPLIDTENIISYYTPAENLLPCTDKTFHRDVRTRPSIFKAPHLVMKQSNKDGDFKTAFLDYDAVFNTSIFGMHGDELLLKYICLLTHSSLFPYYLLLTSSRWMIERDEMLVNEITAFPIPYEKLDANRELIENTYNHFAYTGVEDKELLDHTVMELYGIDEFERRAIQETLDLNLDYYNNKQRSSALKTPTNEMINIYKSTIENVLKTSFGDNTYFKIETYDYNGPLLIAEIQLRENNQKNKPNIYNAEYGKKLLDSLNSRLIEQKSQSVYVKRNVKFYDKDSIFLIKPRMKLYWSTIAAMYDADNIYMDIMKAWRKVQ
jgi:hypothetical protein